MASSRTHWRSAKRGFHNRRASWLATPLPLVARRALYLASQASKSLVARTRLHMVELSSTRSMTLSAGSLGKSVSVRRVEVKSSVCVSIRSSRGSTSVETSSAVGFSRPRR